MTQKAPGKHYRKGLSLIEAVKQFSDEREVESMFVRNRWPNGVACPKCGSVNIQERTTRKPQAYRCRDCRKDFSVKTGTVMQGSNIPLSKWALAAYLMTTNLKGVSSMKLTPRPWRHTENRMAPYAPHPQGDGITATDLLTARSKLTRLTLAARKAINTPANGLTLAAGP